MGARLKFWRRSRVPKKGSRDEPLVTAPPSNLTRLILQRNPLNACGSLPNTLEARSEERSPYALFRKRVQENGSCRVSQYKIIWATSLKQGIKMISSSEIRPILITNFFFWNRVNFLLPSSFTFKSSHRAHFV